MTTITKLIVRKREVGWWLYRKIRNRHPEDTGDIRFCYRGTEADADTLAEVEAFLKSLGLKRTTIRANKGKKVYRVVEERTYRKRDLYRYEYLEAQGEAIFGRMKLTDGRFICEKSADQDAPVDVFAVHYSGEYLTVVNERAKAIAEEGGFLGFEFAPITIEGGEEGETANPRFWVLGSTVRLPRKVTVEAEKYNSLPEYWFRQSDIASVEPFDIAWWHWCPEESGLGTYCNLVISQRFFSDCAQHLEGIRYRPVHLLEEEGGE